VSDATIRDVLAVSRAPVMASHSSCRALSSIPRNLTDDQIKQIAGKGGVVMINVSSSFLDQKVYDQFTATLAKVKPEYLKLKAKYAKDPARLRAELTALSRTQDRGPRAAWTKVVDHIEHVIAIGGEDAVGIGSDFDGIPDPPAGLDDVSFLPKISEELLRRGHSEAQVKKVLGENLLAFFARVEAAKAKLASEPPMTTVYSAK
jgi:membrane dipeptidase